MKLLLLGAVPMFLFAIVGCSSGADGAANATTGAVAAGDTATSGAASASAANSSASSTSSQGLDSGAVAPKDGEEVAVLDTDMGKIVFKFFPDKAPNTVANFKKLANAKFYDGTKFHRVIPDFMIQGGDPNTKTSNWNSYGQGGSPDKVKAEFNDIDHERGVVSMARSSDPDSASSQFFICVGHPSFLNHQYTAFGKVIQGMDVADKIVEVPTVGAPTNQVVQGKEPVVKTIRIEKWPLK